MHTITTPNTIDTPLVSDAKEFNSIPDILISREKINPQAHLFSIKNLTTNSWDDISAQQFYLTVKNLAKSLIASGVEPGDRIAIMSKTRYEWTVVDFAIWFAGAISVPIYETSSPLQINFCLSDSDTKAIFIETDNHLNTIKNIKDDLPNLDKIWKINLKDLEELSSLGKSISENSLENRYMSLKRDTIATIIYTSGTTGKPKGCSLTHGNFVSLINNTAPMFEEIVNPYGKTIIFLPLAHVLARFISILVLSSGMKVGHTSDMKNIVSDLTTFQPTFLLAVPRIFEKIYHNAQEKALESNREKIFAKADRVAVAYSKEQQAGKITLKTKILHAIFDKIVYVKIRKALGSKATHALSGGAPLSEHLGHFFRGIGITILEGYGLTETCGPTSVHLIDNIIIGTIGTPLPGVSIKINPDGEILVKGINVMQGYWKDPESTAEAMQDGWLHTGDLGEITENNLLKITGRKKEIIVTASGKNVSPAPLENNITTCPIISQCMLVGEKRKFIAALITLDEINLPKWLERNSLKNNLKPQQLTENPKVIKEIQDFIDKTNQLVSRAETIKKFVIIPQDFTEEAGYLTPSLKIKRNKILADFSHIIDNIYDN